MKKDSNLYTFLIGIIVENPVFVLVLGTCPTLAITKSVVSAIGMGLAATAVLICSNMVISLLRKLIPESVRIPCYIVVIASFVTLVQMLMHAFVPAIYEMLGVFLPLITVNCIILGRAEMFASKNPIGKSALDGLGMGIGFTLALLAISLIREVFGAGAFAGIEIPFMQDYKIKFLVEAPGGFLVYGIMIALVYKLTHGKAPYKKEFSCENCPSAAFCNKSACQTKEEI